MSLPAPSSAVLGSENLARTTVICPGFALLLLRGIEPSALLILIDSTTVALR
jgi:hypothetical protein